MISIDLPDPLEKQFLAVITDCYGGDLQQAIVALLQLQKKYGWKEQLLSDVESVREEVRRTSGITAEEIDNAVKKYRQGLGSSGEKAFTCRG